MSDIKMPDMNSVLIAGTLTSEPVISKTPEGISVANFFIASNKKYKDNSGIWRESVCYVGVTAWSTVAETCSHVVKKGNTVLVSGELLSKNWKLKDSLTKTVIEIRARRIQFLDQKSTQAVENYFSQIPDEPAVESKTPEAPIQNTPSEISVEPTEFDFGYQNLKL
jgi:single-strand DNA-binding protein